MSSRKSTSPPEPDDEDCLLWLAFLVGLPPVVVILLRGVAWGPEPTLGLLVCLAAGRALSTRVARRSARRREKSNEERGRGAPPRR